MDQDRLIREAARLAVYRKNFPLFAEDRLRIVTKDAGSDVQPFILYPFQRILHQRVMDQMKRRGWVRQVWLKGRQAGFSTMAQGLVFWRTVLNPNTNALVVAHDTGSAQTIFNMARRFYDNLDKSIKPMVRYSTKAELVFDNPNDRERAGGIPGLNSRITVATARNIHSGAGSTLHCVHLSEAARYPNAVEIEGATLDAVPSKPGTFVLIESTARPEGFWFRDMCDRAQSGHSPYEFHFVPWTEDPSCVEVLDPGETLETMDLSPEERDLALAHGLTAEQIKWRRFKLAEKRGNPDEFAMEYPITAEEAFIMREYGVFPVHHLRALYAGLHPPRYRADVVGGRVFRAQDGALAVWAEPDGTAMYDIGVDVALGHQSGDWSTAVVVKRPTGEQVAEYRAHVEPGEFADTLDGLGRWYNTAQVAIEINGPGLYTNERLALTYPNLYIWRRTDKIKQRMSNFWGWETSHKSKVQLVALAKDRLYRYASATPRPGFPLVRSEALYKELSTFAQEPGTDNYAGASGAPDDLVMAWMIALKCSSDEFGMTMEPLATADAPEAPHPPGCTCQRHEPRLWMTPEEAAPFGPGVRDHESREAWDPIGYA